MDATQLAVGLMQLPELEAPLSAAGIVPILGDDLRSTASAIKDAIVSGAEVKVIARFDGQVAVTNFVTRAATAIRTPGNIAVLCATGQKPKLPDTVVVFTLPVRMSKVTEAIGIQDFRFDSIVVDENGTPVITAPEPEIEEDDWLVAPPTDSDLTVETETSTDAISTTGPDMEPGVAEHALNYEEHPDDEVDAGSQVSPPAKVPPPPRGKWVYRFEDDDNEERAGDQTISTPGNEHEQPAQGVEPESLAHTAQVPQPLTEPIATTTADGEGTDSARALIAKIADPTLPAHTPEPTGPEPIGAGSHEVILDAMDIVTGTANDSRPGATPVRRIDGRTTLAPVLIVFAGKGGVGKTTFSLNVAQRAAEKINDFKVTLIDANRGQGDTRKYLRVPRDASVRSVGDATVSGNPASGIISASELNAARGSKLPDAMFSIALAPPYAQSDATLADTDTYVRVVELARRHSDLVVIDTQIIESLDPLGVVDRLIAPLLIDGAWGLAVTDTSSVGMSNLLDALKMFSAKGVTSDRISLVVNRVVAEVSDENLRTVFGAFASSLARAGNDDSIVLQMNVGRFVHSEDTLAPIIDHVLYRVTGADEVAPKPSKKSNKARRDSNRKAAKRKLWSSR